MRDFITPIISGSIRIGLANTEEEIVQIQKLKFNSLLKEFNPTIQMEEERFIDDNDRRCDYLIAVDTNTDKIVATYKFFHREQMLPGERFNSQDEFDLGSLVDYRSVELSRACIQSEYRNSLVLMLMWKGVFVYCRENKMRFLFGTLSFYGNNIDDYKNAFSYLYHKHLNGNPYKIHAINSCAKMDYYDIKDINEKKIKEELNPLIKGYLAMGGEVGDGVFIDSWFNSIDVLVYVDLANLKSPLARKIANRK